MKKIFKFAAALAVILPVSCNKEIATPEVAPEAKTVKVVMNALADDPATKITLGGNHLKWEVGDELKCRFGNPTQFTDGTQWDVLTATNSGSGAQFTGDFKYFPGITNGTVNQHLYVISSTDGAFANKTSIQFLKTVSSEQTGKPGDLKDNMIFSAWVTKTMMTCEDEETVSFNAYMSPHFSVVKLNVPEVLGVKEISMEAESNIAGQIRVYPARTPGQNGGVGSNALVYRPEDDGAQSKTITVSDGGNILSGDVYFVVVPDAYDSSIEKASVNNYYCSTEKLKFTFVSDDATAEYEKILNSKIYCGELVDLGAVPATMMSSLAIKSSSNTDMVMSVNAANSECTYYYEVAATEEKCADPTESSAQFDPATGFNLAMTKDTYMDKYFVKVLVKSSNHSRILKASVRLWSFREGNNAGEILLKAKDGEALTEKGTEVEATNGLKLKRMSDYSNNDIRFEQTSTRIAIVTARMALYMPLENTANVTMYFCVDQKTCIGTGKRSFNLYLNDARINSCNGYETKYTLNGADYEAGGKLPISWQLGRLNAGDKVSVAGDGQHVLYNMALLEVL